MPGIRTIKYSPHFLRAAKKLDAKLAEQAGTAEAIFRKDCFDSRLKTHKLKGNLRDKWSFSISYSYRVLFVFEDKDSVTFLDVDDHSIYQ